MTTKELASKIYNFATSNKDGFTLDLTTLKPITSGYVASYKATQNSFSEDDLRSVIAHALNNDCVVGGWYNSKDKRYYFDSNKVFADINEAIKFGFDNEQIAIFDIDTKQEIRLEGQPLTEAETANLICPVHYLSYIYSADMSGLTDEEIEHIDTVLNGYGWVEAVNIDSPFFSYSNDFNNLGAECVILNAYK